MNWNGRTGEFFKNMFASALSSEYHFLFSLINAFIGVSSIYLFFFLIFGRFIRFSLNDIAIISFIMLFIMSQAAFIPIFCWAAGSTNYLWAYFLLFLFLMPYRILYKNILLDSNIESNKPKILASLFMFLFGVIVGWGSEFNIVLVIVSVLIIAFAIYKKIKLPMWVYFGMLGFLIGWIFLFMSPGSAKRILVIKEMGLNTTITISEFFAMNLSEKLMQINLTFKAYSKTLLALLIIGFSLFLYIFNKNKIFKVITFCILFSILIALIIAKQFFLISIICLIGFFIFFFISYKNNLKAESKTFLILFLLISLSFLYTLITIQVGIPSRAKLHFRLIEICFILCICFYLAPKFPRLSFIIKNGVIFACFIYAVYVSGACLDMAFKWNKMLGSIEAQKELGINEVIVNQDYFTSYYKGYGTYYLSINPDEWPNTSYAKYFGVEKIMIK